MVPLGAVRSDARKRLMESTVEPPCDGRDVDQYPPRSASPRPGGRGAARRVPTARTGDICSICGSSGTRGRRRCCVPTSHTGYICSICGTITHAVLAPVPDRVWTVLKDTTGHQPVCLDCLDDLVRAAGFTPGWVIHLAQEQK